MSIWSWFREAVGLVPAPNEEETPVAHRESIGVTIDADEDQWRKLTGSADRDLTPMSQHRMRELAYYLWQANPLANRLIELPVAYILAEGVRLECKDPDAQMWVDAFWNDPINCMDLKLVKKVRELALFGEQCWPAFVNEISGHVRLGYLDPGLIETVVRDPDNAEQPIGIVTVKDKKGHARRYRVIVNGPESVFTERTQKIRETFGDGDAFYFTINDLSNGARGRSDLLAEIDWLDAYEQFLFGELERGNHLRSFIWDVTLKGATPDEVKARAKQIATPKPGSVRVHNDAEEWKSESPELGQYESAAGARMFRNHIIGGLTMPEHWFGGGGDVNRATAGEMGEPTFKVFSMRQRHIKYMLEMIGAFVIWRRLDPTGRQPFDPAAFDEETVPAAIFPELTSRDTSTYAQALSQVVIAAAMAIDRGLMTERLALLILEAVAARLGVSFDVEAELEAARAEAAERRANDLPEPMPPEDTPPGVTAREGGDGDGP